MRVDCPFPSKSFQRIIHHLQFHPSSFVNHCFDRREFHSLWCSPEIRGRVEGVSLTKQSPISANTGVLGLFYALNDRGGSPLLPNSKEMKERSVVDEILRLKDLLVHLSISGFSYFLDSQGQLLCTIVIHKQRLLYKAQFHANNKRICKNDREKEGRSYAEIVFYLGNSYVCHYFMLHIIHVMNSVLINSFYTSLRMNHCVCDDQIEI